LRRAFDHPALTGRIDIRFANEGVGNLAIQLAQGPTLAFGGVKKYLQMASNDSLELRWTLRRE
jgi:hypothetical protein